MPTPFFTIYFLDLRNVYIEKTSFIYSDFSAIASVTGNDPQNSTIPNSASDVRSRATVSLGIDTNIATSSQLKLEFVTQQIVCTDEGEYRCTVTYPNANGVPVTDTDNTTLSVYALPYDISLIARDSNGLTMVGTANDPVEINVGDEVSFSCSAKIGSDITTTLSWKVTSQTSANYIPYNPPTISYDDGTATGPSNCSYTRTATMKYNITTLDVSRTYGLAFQCYVSVKAPTGTYSVPNPPTFYIKAIEDSTTQSTTGFRSTTPVADSTIQSTTGFSSTTSEVSATTPVCSTETVADSTTQSTTGFSSTTPEHERLNKDYIVPTSPSGISPATPSYVNSDFRMTGNNTTVTTNTHNQESGPYMELQLGLREQADHYESLTSH